MFDLTQQVEQLKIEEEEYLDTDCFSNIDLSRTDVKERQSDTPSKFWEYLLPNGIQVKNIALFVPPMRSSGDVYHIFVFVLLAKKFNESVPEIFLARHRRYRNSC